MGKVFCYGLAAVLLLSLSLKALGAETQLKLPGGPRVIIWNPSASVVGQPQADARLDKPAKFWRAGLTLTEVFADIKTQTGVELKFWPPEDQNTRVRVNLFLNPKNPPPLRALMAQLMWVTRCSFASAEQKDPKQSRIYHLLSTSIGQGILAKAESEKAKDTQDRVSAHDKWVSESRSGIAKQLAESERALELSRRDLIAKYKGRDDYLLLTLLDPKRRTALEFVCNLPEQTRKDLLQGKEFYFLWSELNSEQHTQLQSALGIEARWLNEGTARVQVSGVDHGQLYIGAQVKLGGDEFRMKGKNYVVAIIRACTLEEMDSGSQLALGRILGEINTPEQEKEYVARWNKEYQRKFAQRESLKLSAASLTEEMIDTLAAIPVALADDRGYTLWELQEIVARDSGLNVVSDCFVDMPRNYFRGEKAVSSALEAFNEACRPNARRAEMLEDALPESVGHSLAWEWGDAGSFLHFRSLHADIWRASLLPNKVATQFDKWVSPYLASATKPGQEALEATVPLDLKQLAVMMGGLDQMQERYGFDLIYEDPAKPISQLKQAFREEFVRSVLSNRIFHVLFTLSSKQWQKFNSEGLNFGSELSPAQQADLHASYSYTLLQSRKKISDNQIILKFESPPSAPRDSDIFRIRFFSGGEVVGEIRLQARIRVKIQHPRTIVSH